MKVLHIAHVALKISDTQKSMNFYSDILGLKKRFTLYPAHDNTLPWIIYMKVNQNQSIELFPDYDGLVASHTKNASTGVGFSHIVMEYKDFDSAHKRCLEGGVISLDCGDDGFFVNDPDGNLINIKKGFSNEEISIKNVCYGTSSVDKCENLFSNILGLTKEDGECAINSFEGLCFKSASGDNVAKDDFAIGYLHLSLETDDIHKMYEYCLEKGVNVTVAPKMGGDYTYQFWITDTDGNRIEFMQYTEKSLQVNT